MCQYKQETNSSQYTTIVVYTINYVIHVGLQPPSRNSSTSNWNTIDINDIL